MNPRGLLQPSGQDAASHAWLCLGRSLLQHPPEQAPCCIQPQLITASAADRDVLNEREAPAASQLCLYLLTPITRCTARERQWQIIKFSGMVWVLSGEPGKPPILIPNGTLICCLCVPWFSPGKVGVMLSPRGVPRMNLHLESALKI